MADNFILGRQFIHRKFLKQIKMKPFGLLLTAFVFTASLHAQTTEDSVKATINQLFAGMKAADPAMVRASFADSAILQTISRNKEGAYFVKNESVEAFAGIVAATPPNAADERIRYETIRIDGPLVSVWTPYQFYYDGKFSHCGVNSFQLVKLKGEWKIQYLIDTRRRQGCE